MHVAILTPGFAVDEADTNCVPALQDYLLALRRRVPSIALTVFALRYPHTRARYDWQGIAVHPANGRTLKFPLSLFSWGRLMRSFSRVTRQTPFQLVHSFWLGECAFLGERLARIHGLPHILTLMGQEVAQPNRYASVLKSPRTTVVAVSDFQRRALLKSTGFDAQRVIPWGLEAVSFGDEGMRDIDVLGVGSLTPVKDFTAFLDVITRVRERKPALTCRIAGEGPLRSALEEKARALGLERTVTFEGRVSREAVLALMRRSRVLLHTSSFESFGLVFAEALACGARIVSRPVGIAQADADWAVCRRPGEMAKAIEKFLALPDMAPRLAYPIESTVDAYAALYASSLPIGASKLSGFVAEP